MSEGSVWFLEAYGGFRLIFLIFFISESRDRYVGTQQVPRPLPLYFKVSLGVCTLFIGPFPHFFVYFLFSVIGIIQVPMVKQLPASRHGEAGEAIAEAFLVEAKMQK